MEETFLFERQARTSCKWSTEIFCLSVILFVDHGEMSISTASGASKTGSDVTSR
jgi:hypothetical protein